MYHSCLQESCARKVGGRVVGRPLPGGQQESNETDFYSKMMLMKQQRDEEINALRLQVMNQELNAPFAPEILELSDIIIGDRSPAYITEVLAQPKCSRGPPRPDVANPADFLKSNRSSGNARRAPPPPHVSVPPLMKGRAPDTSPPTSPGRTEHLLNRQMYAAIVSGKSPAEDGPRFEQGKGSDRVVWSPPQGEMDNTSGRSHRKQHYSHIDKKGHNVGQIGGLRWERSLRTGDIR